MSPLILAEGFAHACDFMLVFDKGDPNGDAAHGRSHSRSLRKEVSGPCWRATLAGLPRPSGRRLGWSRGRVGVISPDLRPALRPPTIPIM